MLLLKLAWRNLLRNSRRTALTVALIAIGVAAMAIAWAVFDGGNKQSINMMTGTFTGHVQVHLKGYTDDPGLDRTFAASEVDIARLAGVPGVRAIAPRLQTPVMISTDDNSRGVLLVGVDPRQEQAVTSLHKKLTAGQWISDDQAGGVIIGNTLAKALKIGIGDDVAVLTQGMQGSIGALRLKVVGIYATGNEVVDGLQAFISLNDAKTLLSAGEQLTTLALKLDHYDRSQAAVEGLIGLLPPAFEVKGWAQLLPDMAQKVDFHEWVATVVMVVLFGIVAVGVANTILMSVLERMREFGTVMALGAPPAQVFRLIMTEAAVLALLGFIIGMVIGGGAVACVGTVGIDFSDQSALQQMQGLSNKLYPHLALKRITLLAIGVALVAVGSALSPAWKAARMVPLSAMRGLGSVTRSGANGSARTRMLLPMLALRNIARHPTRSLLTGFGVTFAMAAFVFLGCFLTGYYQQLVENATGFMTGDGQVLHRDYRVRLESALALEGGAALLEQIAGAPGIRSASARVQTPGLVSSAKGAEPVQLLGVQPDREKTVTFLYKSVRQGRYLDAARDHEVVIGRKLADRLRVGVGEKVVVTAQDVRGSLAAEAFIVVGLFDTGSHGFDETMAQVSLPALQRMLGLGERYTSIAFRSVHPEHAAMAQNAVRQLLTQPDAKVYAWQELVPEVVQMNTMFKGSLLVVMFVVFVTLAVVIMNTVLMSVLERTREFGTMLALGSTPRLIVRLVLLEAAMIGASSSFLGVSLGALGAWVHSTKGISMKAHAMTAIPGTTDLVYPQLSWAATVQPGMLMPLMIVLVSLYPAWRASRLDPIQALKSV